MKAQKLSVSFDSELADEVREAARRSGKSVSAWLAKAALEQLRGERLDAFLDDWEAEVGPFTEEELEQAAIELGFKPAPSEHRAAS
jgi:hypothetical protein